MLFNSAEGDAAARKLERVVAAAMASLGAAEAVPFIGRLMLVSQHSAADVVLDAALVETVATSLGMGKELLAKLSAERRILFFQRTPPREHADGELPIFGHLEMRPRRDISDGCPPASVVAVGTLRNQKKN